MPYRDLLDFLGPYSLFRVPIFSVWDKCTCQYTTKLMSYNCFQVYEGSKLAIIIHCKISLKYHDIFWILQYRDISKWCNILLSQYIAIQNAHPWLAPLRWPVITLCWQPFADPFLLTLYVEPFSLTPSHGPLFVNRSFMRFEFVAFSRPLLFHFLNCQPPLSRLPFVLLVIYTTSFMFEEKISAICD